MTNSFERVDLGNIRGKEGSKGLDGAGIETIIDLGYSLTDEEKIIFNSQGQDTYNPNSSFHHYYKIIFTDHTDTPFIFYVKDGENLSLINYVDANKEQGVTSKAIYTEIFNKSNRDHQHGDILSDGTITSNETSFDKNDKPLVADNSDRQLIKRGYVGTDHIKDHNNHQYLETNANATQTTINNQINQKLENLNDALNDKMGYGEIDSVNVIETTNIDLNVLGVDSPTSQSEINQRINDVIASLPTGGSGGTSGNITIDSSLSTVSTNPVQNKTLTNTLNEKTGKGETGGVNLLHGTPSTTLSGGNNITLTNETYHEQKVYSVDNTEKTSTQYTEIYFTIPYENFTHNDVFTFSFYAKGTLDKSFRTYFYQTNSITSKRIYSNSTVNTSAGTFGDGNTEFKLTTDWKKHYVTYQLNSSGGTSTVNKKISIRVYGTSQAYITGIQLERGYNYTDYNNKAEAEHNHNSTDIITTKINMNTDLNNVVKTGLYYNNSTSECSTITHLAETGKAFSLLVEDWNSNTNYTKQTITHYDSGKTYQRINNNGTWTGWNRLISADDKSTTVPGADTVNGTTGSSTNYARSDHQHPKSTIYAETGHSHGNLKSNGTIGTNTNSNYFVTTTTGGGLATKQKIGQIDADGKIGTTANKPVITTTNGTLTVGGFETSANQIKMNGTANTGSSNMFARSDHVHPSDTSKSDVSHQHGNITSNGTLNSSTSSPNNIVVTDSSNNLKTIDKIPWNKLNITSSNISSLELDGLLEDDEQELLEKLKQTRHYTIISNNNQQQARYNDTFVCYVEVTDGLGNTINNETLNLYLVNSPSLNKVLKATSTSGFFTTRYDTWGLCEYEITSGDETSSTKFTVMIDNWTIIESSESGSYEIGRNNRYGRLILRAYAPGFSIGTSWTNFGGNNKYAQNCKPAGYVTGLASEGEAIFRVKPDGQIQYKSMSGTLSATKEFYLDMIWELG